MTTSHMIFATLAFIIGYSLAMAQSHSRMARMADQAEAACRAACNFYNQLKLWNKVHPGVDPAQYLIDELEKARDDE